MTTGRIYHKQISLANFYRDNKKLFPKFLRAWFEQNVLFRVDKSAYNHYISLGNNCLTAFILKDSELRKFSGPFDWIGGPGLELRFKFISNKFDHWLDFDDLEFTDITPPPGENTIPVFNKRLGLNIRHDFNKSDNGSYEQEYLAVTAKYKRRQDRFYRVVENSNTLLLYIEHYLDSYEYENNIEEILSNLTKITKQTKAKKFDLLLCVRGSFGFDFVDIYERGPCRIFLQRLNPEEIGTPGHISNRNTKLNDSIRRALTIATNH